MRTAIGYYRTLRQYFRTPKGRHDVLDYGAAAGRILLTVALVGAALCLAEGI